MLFAALHKGKAGPAPGTPGPLGGVRALAFRWAGKRIGGYLPPQNQKVTLHELQMRPRA